MSTLGQLLVVQGLDTQLTQLRHRLDHLPEAADVQRLAGESANVESRSKRTADENSVLVSTIASNEARVDEIRKKAERLNAQLKTVIAPREAEALQHELSVLAQEASALDDAALEALDRSERLDAEQHNLRATLDVLAEQAATARTALDQARAEVSASIDDVIGQRAAAAEGVDGKLLADYDARRRTHAGVAVAKLVKSTCGGCHIDLSTTEIERLRRVDEAECECPNCARWLVL